MSRIEEKKSLNLYLYFFKMISSISIYILILLIIQLMSNYALIPPQTSILPKQWTLEGENYVRRPKEQPVAVVHFIGGAGERGGRGVIEIVTGGRRD